MTNVACIGIGNGVKLGNGEITELSGNKPISNRGDPIDQAGNFQCTGLFFQKIRQNDHVLGKKRKARAFGY